MKKENKLKSEGKEVQNIKIEETESFKEGTGECLKEKFIFLKDVGES